MNVKDTVTVDMGYRVYETETSTRARISQDYKGVSFELLNKAGKKRGGSMMLSAIATTTIAALSILLAF